MVYPLPAANILQPASMYTRCKYGAVNVPSDRRPIHVQVRTAAEWYKRLQLGFLRRPHARDHSCFVRTTLVPLGPCYVPLGASATGTPSSEQPLTAARPPLLALPSIRLAAKNSQHHEHELYFRCRYPRTRPLEPSPWHRASTGWPWGKGRGHLRDNQACLGRALRRVQARIQDARGGGAPEGGVSSGGGQPEQHP